MFTMQNWRSVAVGCLSVALVTIGAAQFDGPAPLAWRFQQSAAVPPGGSPIVSGDTVYVSVGQRVYALNKSTGNQKWRYPAADPIDGYFRVAPVLVGDILIAAADNKTVYGISVADGSTKWSYIMRSGVLTQPVRSGSTVVIPTADNTLVALNAADGVPLAGYPYSVDDGIQGNLAAYQDTVLFFTGANELRALDVLKEKTLWHQRFTSVPSNAEPTIFGEYVYSVSGQFLVALSAASGTMRFQTPIGDESAFGPAVSASGIMTVTPDGNANFFDLDGKRILKAPMNLGSLPAVKPTAVGKYFVAATTNGAINLVDPATGTLLWSYLVRPAGGIVPKSVTNGTSPGAGGGQGKGGGPPGGPGLGGGTGTLTNSTSSGIFTVRASGPPVVDGTTLLMLAQDGSLLAFDRGYGVDLTPPEVDMIWPAAGSLVSGRPPLDIVFTLADDASGINEKTIKVDVDGTPLDFEFGRDGFLVVRISELGKNAPLADGRRILTVTVSDWMGNEAKAKFSLTIDNTLKPLGRPVDPGNNGGIGSPGGPGGGGKGGGGGAGGGR